MKLFPLPLSVTDTLNLHQEKIPLVALTTLHYNVLGVVVLLLVEHPMYCAQLSLHSASLHHNVRIIYYTINNYHTNVDLSYPYFWNLKLSNLF